MALIGILVLALIVLALSNTKFFTKFLKIIGVGKEVILNIVTGTAVCAGGYGLYLGFNALGSTASTLGIGYKEVGMTLLALTGVSIVGYISRKVGGKIKNNYDNIIIKTQETEAQGSE